MEIAGRGTFGGSAIWMQAPEQIETRQLALTLMDQSVLIEAGQHFFSGSETPQNFYRLAYSSIPSTRIPEGISLIAQAIAKLR
jgi:GntR family transcriptional regulator/MocR family aminotransferase